jgi:hypothetical protein
MPQIIYHVTYFHSRIGKAENDIRNIK